MCSVVQRATGDNFFHGNKNRPWYRSLPTAPFLVPTEEIILKSASRVHSWPHQVLNHIMIRLRALTEAPGVVFYAIQGKPGLVEKKFPLLPLVAGVHQGEDIPHPIPNRFLTALILVGIGGDFHISLPRNSI